jgi:hypothetical protein
MLIDTISLRASFSTDIVHRLEIFIKAIFCAYFKYIANILLHYNMIFFKYI